MVSNCPEEGFVTFWKTHGRTFGCVSPGVKRWRQRVGQLAEAIGIGQDDFDWLSKVFGIHWGTACVTQSQITRKPSG